MPRPRVLIADDDPRALQAMTGYLQIEGFECSTVASADAAIVVIGRQRPDAVILDFDMPGRASDEVCRSIRQDPATQRLPLLLFAHTEEQTQAAHDAGATAVLPKPFHLADVAATLRVIFPDLPLSHM